MWEQDPKKEKKTKKKTNMPHHLSVQLSHRVLGQKICHTTSADPEKQQQKKKDQNLSAREDETNKFKTKTTFFADCHDDQTTIVVTTISRVQVRCVL